MSQIHYNSRCEEISDEDLIGLAEDVIPLPPKTPRKAARKRRVTIFESDGEDRPCNVVRKVKKLNPLSVMPAKTLSETNWQHAMELTNQLCIPLKVDVKDVTLLPDSASLECFRKAAQAWLNDKKIYVPLTYSTQKSLTTLIGRFLFDFVMRSANLSSTTWNINGCVIWDHKCLSNDTLKCLHGLDMIIKENIVEMDVASENGQRALKENPTRTKVTTNKWGRNVVQLRNEDSHYCSYDQHVSSGNFSDKSCGLHYVEGKKALQAFYQIMTLQSACYPKMPNAKTHLLMPIKCDCNWANNNTPLMGRQLCKITPYALSAATTVDKTLVTDPKILATVNYPTILVFQCCNPVYRNTKTNPQKNCDFKISAPDVISCLQLAKQIWMAVIGNAAPIMLQEFKWSTHFQYRSTILPTTQDDPDDCLF